MTRRNIGAILVLAALVLAVSAGFNLQAQGPRGPNLDPQPEGVPPLVANSVQEALLKPYHFTFARPTPLEDVAKQLGRSLRAPVAIDRAALDRLGLKMNDVVQLELESVRLKTGLKLLLDQLDLTYRVVPEDNLLVITDAAGSADPIDQVLSELKALHRDLHDVQDSVDDIHAAMGLDEDEGAKMRKPTIIEEMPHPGDTPEKEKARPKDQPAAPSTPRSRPGA